MPTHRGGLSLKNVGSLFLLSILWLFFAALLPSKALARKYKLEIVISSEGTRRAFTYEAILERREYRDFEFNKRKFLKEHLLQATKDLAKKRGYIPEIYGDDFHKLVNVRSWRYEIEDLRRNNVVNEGRGRG